MTNWPPPPHHVEPYVRVLGVAGAFDFIMRFGGGEIYLTTNPKKRSQVADQVGHDKAIALAEAIGNLKVRVPTAKPWLAACMKTEGLQTAVIARRLHTSDTTVRNWLRGIGTSRGNRTPDPRQLTLF